MIERGWLKRTWGRSVPALAEELLARWPDGLEKDNEAPALANRLRDTDAGKRTKAWWHARAALVPVLADLLHQPQEDVWSWIEAAAPAAPSEWAPPGLRTVIGARVEEPPVGLWSPHVATWVRRIDRGEAGTTHAWLTFEPGVAGEWLKEWFDRRKWHLHRAAGWSEAQKKLFRRGRNVVHLLGERPADPVFPAAPKGTTVLVLACYTPPRPKEQAPSWGEPPMHAGWALLDASEPADAREFLAWFRDHVAPDDRPTDEEIRTLLKGLPRETTTGELLQRLDLIGEADAAAALLGRVPELPTDALLAMERKAARQGYLTRRTLDAWERLVPADTAEDTLARVGRSLKRLDVDAARKLVDGRPRAIVERLVDRGLLQPCVEPDAPAAAWQLWPRWLGHDLAGRAIAVLAGTPGDIGVALLAGEAGVAKGLAALEQIVGDDDWDAVRRYLRVDLTQMPGVASVEAVALVLGHRVLDRGGVPRAVAKDVVTALARARAASGDARLFAHGVGRTGPDAFVLAEWALGHRADDPRFGPWADGPLDPALWSTVGALDAALKRWNAQADDASVDAGIRAEARTLAGRVLRLGSLLFERRGRLAVPDGDERRKVWAFQVPALLREVCAGRDVLPGRTADELLREQHPNLPEASREAKRLLDTGGFDGDLERAGKAFLLTMQRGLAEGTPEARARVQALREVADAASRNFALVRAEVERCGGDFAEVLGWLWERWNDPSTDAWRAPPVALVRDGHLDDARLVWCAPPDGVRSELWEKAARVPAFWDVLSPAAWRAWALAANDVPDGWTRMPVDVLVSLFDASLPEGAYAAAWNRDVGRTLDWLGRRLGDEAAARCLNATPASLVPDVLALSGAPRLPRAWLQHVVTARMPGWREAWPLLRGHVPTPS